MHASVPILDQLLRGPLLVAPAPWPLVMVVRLCDLQPRFLAKGRAGRSCRSVSRNGRVLLASHLPLAALADRVVQLRLQTWHKIILPGETPRAWGILMCIPGGLTPPARSQQPIHETRLVREAAGAFDLALELGGGLSLEFRRSAE